jgi:hypothetical protein
MKLYVITQMLGTKLSNVRKICSILICFFSNGYFVVEAKEKFFIREF